MQLYSVLRETMNQIMEHRREIIFGKLTKVCIFNLVFHNGFVYNAYQNLNFTQDQQSEVREKVTLKVDFINRYGVHFLVIKLLCIFYKESKNLGVTQNQEVHAKHQINARDR